MADIDLRAEVLAGINRDLEEIDQEVEELKDIGVQSRVLRDISQTALRHLRGIVERHMDLPADLPVGCGCCGWSRAHGGVACRVILSLAPDYAPDALKEMVK